MKTSRRNALKIIGLSATAFSYNVSSEKLRL